MRINQFFFLKKKKPFDNNVCQKNINRYNFLVFYNYYNWWFLTNQFNFYKKLSIYKVFSKKTLYNYNYNSFFKNKIKFNLINSLYVECLVLIKILFF